MNTEKTYPKQKNNFSTRFRALGFALKRKIVQNRTQKNKKPRPQFKLVYSTKPTKICFHYERTKYVWGHLFDELKKIDTPPMCEKYLSLYEVEGEITSHQCVSFLSKLPGALLTNVAGLTVLIEQLQKQKNFNLENIPILGFARKEDLPVQYGEIVVPEIIVQDGEIHLDFDSWDGRWIGKFLLLVFHD